MACLPITGLFSGRRFLRSAARYRLARPLFPFTVICYFCLNYALITLFRLQTLSSSYWPLDTSASNPSKNDVALLLTVAVCEIVRSWLAFCITSVNINGASVFIRCTALSVGYTTSFSPTKKSTGILRLRSSSSVRTVGVMGILNLKHFIAIKASFIQFSNIRLLNSSPFFTKS